MLDQKVLESFGNIIHLNNPYVQWYLQVHKWMNSDGPRCHECQFVIYADQKSDPRSYDSPTADKVAVVLPGDKSAA
jgi:hypothetical protein